jgi:hypothetical protein
VFNKKIHLLKEHDDNVDENQAAQAQAENPQIFTDDIAVEDPVTFKHL